MFKVINNIKNMLSYVFFKIRRQAFISKSYSQDDPWHSKTILIEIEHELSNLLKDYKFDNALDIGCGEGHFSNFYLKFTGSVTGVDISSIAIKRANELYKQPNVLFHKTSLESISKKNYKYFDIIIFNHILDYLGFSEFPKNFVKNIYQLLHGASGKPKYILIVNPISHLSAGRIHAYLKIFQEFDYSIEQKQIYETPHYTIAMILLRMKNGED